MIQKHIHKKQNLETRPTNKIQPLNPTQNIPNKQRKIQCQATQKNTKMRCDDRDPKTQDPKTNRKTKQNI